MGFFSKIVLIVQIFKKKVRIGLKKCTDCTDFKKKIVRIVRIVFQKLYGFLLKMYGFLYGWVQKSFGHPATAEINLNYLSVGGSTEVNELEV